MVTSIETTAAIFAKHPVHRVYTRERWADEWEEVPYLYCLSCHKAASPDISSATFEWIFGRGLQPDKLEWDTYEPQDILGHYVKVEIDQPDDSEGASVDPITWVGIIEDDLREPDGSLPLENTETTEEEGSIGAGAGEAAVATSSDRIAKGRQTLSAYGMEILLERTKVATSVVDGLDAFDTPTPIGRGIAFNSGGGNRLSAGDPLRGNRCENAESITQNGVGIGVFKFAETIDEETDKWTAADIIRYLLYWCGPKDADGERRITFILDETSQVDGLAYDSPSLESDGRSIKSLLDELITRRYLLGYRLEVETAANPEDPDPVKIKVFTFNEDDITLPDETPIAGNPNTKELNFDGALDVRSAQIARKSQHVVQKVVVRGARRVACFSMTYGEATLAKKWSDDDLTAYNAAASAAGSYPDWDEGIAREQLNATVRASDRLRRVFSYFGLPDNWDGMAGTGSDPVCPKLGADGELLDPPENEPQWIAGLRFARELPLLTDHDYEESITPDSTAPEGSTPENRRPFAMYKITNPDTVDDLWVYLDRGSELTHLPDVDDRHPSGALRMADDALEVIATVHPQHIFGDGEFTPLNDASEVDALYSWHNLDFTVAMECDARVQVQYPEETPEPEEGETAPDVERTMFIDRGPEFRLDYVVPTTIIDLDNAGQRVRSVGGFVRDDREKMKNLARLAFEWYSVERQAFNLTYRQVSPLFELGDLITQIGTGSTLAEVRTVVTSIRWDLVGGTTAITTDFAELDVQTPVAAAR